MPNFSTTKTAKYLGLLSEGEYSEFKKWLSSPWCNSNKKLIELHTVLQRYHPDFKGEKPTKEWLFKKLYPQKKYDDKWMRNILAAMNKQVEKFLIHQRLEKDESKGLRFLGDELLERHDVRNYEKTSGQLIKRLVGKNVLSTDDHHALFWLYDQRYALPESVRNEAGRRKLLLEADHHLDAFYAMQKWRYRIVKAETQRLLQKGGFESAEDDFLHLLAEERGLKIPLLYKNIMEARESEVNSDHYYLVKQKIFGALDELPGVDQHIQLNYLQNLAIQLWVGGDEKMMEELFVLLNEGVSRKVFFFHGILQDRVYSNYVTVGNSLGEYDKVTDFIEKYTHCLKPELQSDGRHWALAHGAFKRGDFSTCVEQLARPTFRAHTFNVQGKILLLQTYFSLTEKKESYYFPFLDLGHSLEKFLKRDRVLSPRHKRSYLNFISKSRKLLNWMTGKIRPVDVLIKIKEEAVMEKNMQARAWLIDQVEKQFLGNGGKQ